MSADSPASILFNIDGYSLEVKDGYTFSSYNSALLLAGRNSSIIHVLNTDDSGNLQITGIGTSGTPSGGVVSVQGVSGGQAIPVSGTVTATNASVSTTGSSPPGSATYVGASVTTSAPSYTNGQLSGLSLNTSGGLRVDGSGVTQPVSIGSNVTVVGAAANGAAVSGNPVLVSGYDGTSARTLKTLTDGTVQNKYREVATFTAISTATAPANNKSMFSIVNTTGSAVVGKIQEVYLTNVQTSAVTGVVITFELRRIVSHSGGTAITAIETMDSSDSLNSSITVRTNATVGTESANLLWRSLWSSDDWGTGTLDVEAHGHAFQTLFPIYSKRTSESKPITLRANEGLTIKCATNTTVGSFDLVVVFTQE